MTPARVFMLSAAILVFASPELFRAAFAATPPYLAVTALLTLLVAAFAVLAPHEDRPSGAASNAVSAAFAGGVAAAAVAIAAYRWTRLAVWLPDQPDRLIAVREATRRGLDGHSPYVVYRAYDAPWEMAMPYGPALWGPYLAAQLLRLDFRLFTIAGELFVPVWCGIAASIEASRGRAACAAGWLALLAALVLTLDVQRFTLIGHTPVYWPLFLVLAFSMDRSSLAAACTMGVLVIARTTMVAMVPVFLFAAFTAERKRFPAVLATMTATIAIGLAPFAIADFHGLWDSMVLSYPRVMKAAVWPVLARPGLETIGVTEWLLETGRDRLIAPVQIAAMLIVYAAAAAAGIRPDRPALPWMALALLAFSMTTLYPVHYLYYDVLLLLVADGVARTVDAAAAPRAAWLVSLAASAAVVAVTVRAAASPFPRVISSEAARQRELRSGFSSIEHDGDRAFSWIVGHEARIVLPRSSAASAVIVLTAESPFDANQPPQHMTALLNGALVGDMVVPPGRRQIRIATARSAWWIGYNELRLVLASTVVPHDVGSGSDRRPLALSIDGIVLEPPAAPRKRY